MNKEWSTLFSHLVGLKKDCELIKVRSFFFATRPVPINVCWRGGGYNVKILISSNVRDENFLSLTTLLSITNR